MRKDEVLNAGVFVLSSVFVAADVYRLSRPGNYLILLYKEIFTGLKYPQSDHFLKTKSLMQ